MWMDPAQGRWVCPRCFESNEADADRCAKCGLERGTDPVAGPAPAPGAQPTAPGTEGAQPLPAAPGSGYGAPAPQSGRPGWLQLVLRFWWVGLLVIVGGVSAVNYLGGSRPVEELAVGDCFDLADSDAEEVDSATKQECTEPHQYEMFFVGDLPGGSYPSESDVELYVEANCFPAFATYIGLEYDSSELLASYFSPSEDGWNDGDHSVQCATRDPNNAELTESLKDAAR
jgi:hypothetical protein